MADMETRIERIPLPIPPRLVVATADGSTEFALSSPELTFGRGEDNDVVVMADAVSRHHASLELREDGVLIKDLGSTNGIAVDGNLVPEVLLGPGVEVTIGTSVTLTYLPPQSVADQLAAMLQTPAVAAAATADAPDATEQVAATMPEADVVEAEPALEAGVVEEEPAPEMAMLEEEEAPAEAEASAEPEASVAPLAVAAQSSWYVARAQGEPAWEGGPYPWEELVALAGEGRLSGSEFIWYESSQTWVAVGDVPGLLAKPGAQAAPEAGVVPQQDSAPIDVAVEEAVPFLRPAGPGAEGSAAAFAEERPSQGWYLSCSGGGSESRIGPCAWVDLLALGRDGAIHAGDFVWHESLGDWQPVEQLPELAQQLRQEAAPEAAAGAGAPAPEVAAVAEAPAADLLAVTQIAEPWEAPAAAGEAKPASWEAQPAAWETPPASAPDAAAVAAEAAPLATAAAAGATDMTVGWFMSRGEGASAWQGGPYSWAELAGFARDARLAAGDLVWHEGYAGWVSPAEVPGLLPTTAASW